MTILRLKRHIQRKHRMPTEELDRYRMANLRREGIIKLNEEKHFDQEPHYIKEKRSRVHSPTKLNVVSCQTCKITVDKRYFSNHRCIGAKQRGDPAPEAKKKRVAELQDKDKYENLDKDFINEFLLHPTRTDEIQLLIESSPLILNVCLYMYQRRMHWSQENIT